MVGGHRHQSDCPGATAIVTSLNFAIEGELTPNATGLIIGLVGRLEPFGCCRLERRTKRILAVWLVQANCDINNLE